MRNARVHFRALSNEILHANSLRHHHTNNREVSCARHANSTMPLEWTIRTWSGYGSGIDWAALGLSDTENSHSQHFWQQLPVFRIGTTVILYIPWILNITKPLLKFMPYILIIKSEYVFALNININAQFAVTDTLFFKDIISHRAKSLPACLGNQCINSLNIYSN